MISRRLTKIICVLFIAVLTALFITVLYFSAPTIYEIPETVGEIKQTVTNVLPDGSTATESIKTEIGKDVTVVRISDLGELGKITKVNYIENKYVLTSELKEENVQIVDLTKPFEFAEKGTLIFIIMNLDPAAEDFKTQAERLSEYKIGDYWHFTLQLPTVFCASNVYIRANLVARNGEIENYDFIDFNTSYDKKTETFSAETATEYLDLQFYTRRTALENSFGSAQIVTVHYQSSGGIYSGIADCPLIGTESAVKGIGQTSQNLSIAFAILAAVVFAVLVVLSVVERSKKFVSAIIWVFGIAVLLLSNFFLGGATGAPLFQGALSLASSFFVLGGALLAVGRNCGRIPSKYIFPAIAAAGALFAFICPFIPYGAASAMVIVCTVVKAVGVGALFSFVIWATIDKKEGNGVLQTSIATGIAVAILASLFLPRIVPAHYDPLFWLCTAATFATFFGVVVIIMDMKRSNVYLTENLHKEVERQVKDIRAVIDERDDLLQFVSHDMKKPLSSAVLLCETAIEREKDAEQIKTIGIIKQDAERVIKNLAEIAAFSKLNYLAEASTVVDISELCALLYKYHEFDCDANGIVLLNTVNVPVKAFVKQKGIENVVSNIIINAIEHADCSTITLSVKSDKKKTVLAIADDGKGIAEDLDVFKPYVSENDTETGGVGLFICKNIIESMNGELTYETGKGGTVFFISLLKA